MVLAMAAAAAALWLRRTEPVSDTRGADDPRETVSSASLTPEIQPSGTPAPAPKDSPDAFLAWMDAWHDADSSLRASLETRGVELAASRRAYMRDLIRADPARAVAEAIPWAARRELPAAVLAQLEQSVSEAGRYEVAIACGMGEEDMQDALERFTTFGGKRYETHTHGRRLDVGCKQTLSIIGVAVDDLLALAESPVRVIPPEERAARGLAANGIAVDVMGEVQFVADLAAVDDLEAGLIAAEDEADPAATPRTRGLAGAQAPQSAYTEGTKTLLYIICDFPNLTGFPQTVATISNAMNTVTTYWDEVSYGKARLVPTFVPGIMRLPLNGESYTNNFSLLLSDARAAAESNGYDSDLYDHYVVLTDENASSINFSYAGKAWISSPGCHLVDPSYTLRTAGHEIGHNFGLRHANYWRTDSDCPIGRDSITGGYVTNTSNAEWIEYGHRFTVMSAQSTADMNDRKAHFAPREKLKVDWLTTNEVAVLTNSASIRLYRFDHRDVTGTPRAIHIKRSTADYTTFARQYWLGYRRAYTDNGWLQEGLQADWVQGTTYGSDGAVMLDMTPYSNDDNSGITTTDDNNDKWDGALLIGRTYSDPTNGIHVTPTARGGSSPNEWMDVQVNIGTFPTNRPPTVSLSASTLTPATSASVVFTAEASDPDGDTLAYEWHFGLPKQLFSNSLNRAQVTNSWSAASEYVVRCVASDMRGGLASTALVVTVGNPGTVYRITGQVLSNGAGVAGVRVYTSHTNMTYTTTDGGYALVDLPAASYTVGAQLYGQIPASAFANPVAVGPSKSDRDFGLPGAPAIRLSATGGLLVAEGSAAVPYIVSLASKPTSTVTITAGTSTGQLSLAGSPVVLVPEDWLHGRTVTVQAVEDILQEANPHAATVTHVVASSDTSYDALGAPSLPVSIAENDFNQPPAVAITNPLSAGVYAEHLEIPIDIDASDSDGSVTQVVVYLNDLPLGALAGSGRVTWPDAAAGDHILTATAWDDQGATATGTPVAVAVEPDLDADGQPDSVDPDDDNDGMTDAFELLHFGGATNGTPELDSDLDRFVNFAEYLAGTDPTNASSFFQVAGLHENTGGISFWSVTGRVYTLQYCTELADGNTWSNVTGQIDIPGTGGNQSLSEAFDTEARMYRLLVAPE